MDDKEQVVRNLAKDIYMKNMLAKFKSITASIPEVGIFWIDEDTNEIYGDGVKLNQALDQKYKKGNKLYHFKIYDSDHYSEWKHIKKENHNWDNVSNTDYDLVPRGRVVYLNDVQNPEFIVYLGRGFDNAQVKRNIISFFKLPKQYVRFDFKDEHYQMQ